MTKVKIQESLDGKWEDGTRPKDLFALHVSRAPAAYVDQIVSGLGSKKKKVQAGCAELASLLSAEHPGLLCPHVDLFRGNLGAKEPIVRWEAVCTMGNLARADDRGVTRDSVEAIASLLHSKSIVLQGHAVRALVKIVAAFPTQGARVLDALLEAKDEFPGHRIGFVVEAMSAFAGDERLAAVVNHLSAAKNYGHSRPA